MVLPSTLGEENWGGERSDLRERRAKQIRARTATARRECRMEQAGAKAECCGFPAIVAGEFSADRSGGGSDQLDAHIKN